jgi:hypothetical protein
MIVREPIKTFESGGIVCVSARFELDHPLPYMPSTLWYRFPEKYAPRLNSRADGFVPTALLVAMYTGEDLLVEGVTSPRMAYHLLEYREIYHSWDPGLFKRVNIKFTRLEPSPQCDERAVCTAFSGGVDSFYTLRMHMEQTQPIPEARVTHGLFIQGLDLRLDDESNYMAAAEPYAQLFNELGLELIQASTNAFQFSEFRVNWTMFFGVPLIGAALLLGPWLRRFYVPSGMPSYHKLFPQGSSPLIDHLLSTESTEIVHHGASVSRYDKTAVLTAWPATYHKLRVCADKLHMHGFENCSICHKCYETVVALELLGATTNYDNFSSKKLTPIDYLRWGVFTHLNPGIVSNLRDRAFRQKRIGMGLWIQAAIALQVIKSTMVKILKSSLSQEQLYYLKRKKYRPESNIE